MGTRFTPGRSFLGGAFISVLTMALAVACGSGEDGDAGVPQIDSGPRTDGGPGRRDAGPDPVDAGDAGGGGDDGGADGGGGVACGGLTCGVWQYCDSGACRDYPACRGDGTCDRPGDVCHNRRCVPGDVDIDGDGSNAAEDCDETNPDRFPGNPEICNMIDEDCDDVADNGDPATLCESSQGGGICISGACSCPPGTFDLDRSVPGCECSAEPASSDGLTCADAIDLGDLADSGTSQNVTGNVLPDDREVWYRFRGVDSNDTACDNLHVRVQFIDNPADTFEFAVARGDCSTISCGEGSYRDFRWATDFRATIRGMAAGQCPCTAAGATRMANVSVCENDTSDYFIRVRRAAGSTLSCAGYTIEVSNGLYDTP